MFWLGVKVRLLFLSFPFNSRLDLISHLDYMESNFYKKKKKKFCITQ